MGVPARLAGTCFSALQRAEIAEIDRETRDYAVEYRVSVLFNEPKLLKSGVIARVRVTGTRFSALQRAEIAEMNSFCPSRSTKTCFSALQRAEIAEMGCSAATSQSFPEFQCSSTSRNC